MENQTNIANEMLSLHQSVFWLGNIPALFELTATVLIFATIVYIKIKINLPGSNMMLIGSILSALSMFIPLLTYGDPNNSKYIIISEFLSSGFLVYAAIGFIRFSRAIYEKNQS